MLPCSFVYLQVVYFTASFPYLLLVIILMRGVTLPGAAEGLKYYLTPDISRLADPDVRTDCLIQVPRCHGFTATMCSKDVECPVTTTMASWAARASSVYLFHNNPRSVLFSRLLPFFLSWVLFPLQSQRLNKKSKPRSFFSITSLKKLFRLSMQEHAQKKKTVLGNFSLCKKSKWLALSWNHTSNQLSCSFYSKQKIVFFLTLLQ